MGAFFNGGQKWLIKPANRNVTGQRCPKYTQLREQK
jgi:hypothetical protein